MPVTLSLMAALAAAAAFCGWRGARPPDFVKGPRLVPWRALMVAFTTVAVLLLVHVGTLLKGEG